MADTHLKVTLFGSRTFSLQIKGMWVAKELICFLLFVLAVVLGFHNDEQLEKDAIIELVNKKQTTWKASRNFAPYIKRSYIKHLLGVKPRPGRSRLPPLVATTGDGLHLKPFNTTHFDAREQWAYCKSLQQVRDQGPCGSCWAVAAAAAFTDRLCIATKGSFNGHLSAEELLTCCKKCGAGCQGGFPDVAWEYIASNGLCTGGDFHSKEGCQPYTMPPCEQNGSGSRKNCTDYGDVPTPRCRNKCYNRSYREHSFTDDHHKAKKLFSISNNNDLLQSELFNHGPVEAVFRVYEDFLSYRTGVYQHVGGEQLAAHAVKVIGWGVENATPYWLVANSWNSDWGDNGFFRIKRGNNECGFEEAISGGYAVV